ncbi:hypothetical protein, partial [Clostridioides difficile]|uniref:hypothetical protein n=1 Tax=Clostridioides difficile TaxID=1496 RepID=UPI001CA5345F
MINKEKTEKTILENHQTEMAMRNPWDKKQGKYRTTRKTRDKAAALSLHLSTTALNVNGLNSPIKKQSG